MIKYSFLLLLLSLNYSSLASILPENNLTIPVSEKNEGLTENEYHFVIDKVAATYRSIIRRSGRRLVINRLWDDPRVNAGTIKKGNELIINLYGGYARHSLVTPDGYALVMCHEIGHHLGGPPKKIFNSSAPGWSSVEGQADYFATLKCLRKIFEKDNNEEIISKLEIPKIVDEKCSLAFNIPRDRAICIRTSLAGLTVGHISAQIRRMERPMFETPDPSIVDIIFEKHPIPQCRLDTYFQGSLCPVKSFESVSNDDDALGTCHLRRGHLEGLRPACWYGK